MRPLLYILPFFAVMGLAFWAYHENYATQGQLKQMARLQDEIGRLRDEIAMQKAEWAYLNRPSRMRDLAALNFDRLGLMPIEPNQLGLATQVVMPAAGPLVVTGTTIAVSAGAQSAGALSAGDLSADPEQEQIP